MSLGIPLFIACNRKLLEHSRPEAKGKVRSQPTEPRPGGLGSGPEHAQLYLGLD